MRPPTSGRDRAIQPPEAVLVLQEITTTWTKTSRGSPAAALRNAVPKAAPLPFPVPPVPVGGYLLQLVLYGESNAFQSPLVKVDLVRPSLKELSDARARVDIGPGVRWHMPNIRVAQSDRGVRVELWWKHGAPRRQYPNYPNFALEPDQWGRVEYNLRTGWWNEGEWYYRHTVLNIGYLSPLAIARFTDTAPDHRIVSMADLW